MSTAKHPQPSTFLDPDSPKRGPVARLGTLRAEAALEDAFRSGRDTPPPTTRRPKPLA